MFSKNIKIQHISLIVLAKNLHFLCNKAYELSHSGISTMFNVCNVYKLLNAWRKCTTASAQWEHRYPPPSIPFSNVCKPFFSP